MENVNTQYLQLLRFTVMATTGKGKIHKCNKNINNLHPLDIIALVVKMKENPRDVSHKSQAKSA